MPDILCHVYSGQLFFSALVVAALAVSSDLAGGADRSLLLQSIGRIVTLCGVALAALSGTPVPLWLAIPGSAGLAFWLFLPRQRAGRRAWAAAVLILVMILSMGWEARFHRASRSLDRPTRIIVLGDSLSSGGFGETQVWADIVSSDLQADLVNLARASDTLAGAVEGQLPDMPVADRGDLVFVELGGNDMLDGIGAGAYARNLEALVGRLDDDGRAAVMFELPLLPGRWAYGAAQRRIARRYGIALVPKRVLACALLEPGNTSDGLHLTGQGHQALAAAVAEWAGWDRSKLRPVER
jgi:acyl-CoA thioesterase-1